jgi:prophage maintenance system killer protein
MLSGLTFLKVDGVNLRFYPGEIEDFAVNIAVDRLDVPAVSAWIRNHLI